MTLPLEGLTVVAVEQAVAAPFASRQLADLGARVIKIERPDGGDFARHYDDIVKGLATYFVWLNRGKQSVTLDLKSPAGRQALETLLLHADVYLQNLAPGVADRMSIAAAQVVARHPRVVACDISGFGNGGPLDSKRAYDLVVQAEAGSIGITGTEESRAKPGIAVSDIAAGMYTYSSILAGLIQRGRTGKGAALSVSMFDATVEWMNYSVYLTRFSGKEHIPLGIGHPAIVPYGAYPTAEGEPVVIAIQNDREWARFAAVVLKRPELVDDSRMHTPTARVANRALVDEICLEAICRLTLSEVMNLLDAAGIANGRLNKASDLLRHPQLTDRGRWLDVETPVGLVPALLPPTISSTWAPAMGAVPGLGQHTKEVLAEFGIEHPVDEAAIRAELTGDDLPAGAEVG